MFLTYSCIASCFASVITWWSPHVPIFFPFKDISHVGVAPTLMTSCLLIALAKTFFQIISQSQVLGVRSSTYLFRGHNSTHTSGYKRVQVKTLTLNDKEQRRKGSFQWKQRRQRTTGTRRHIPPYDKMLLQSFQRVGEFRKEGKGWASNWKWDWVDFNGRD